MDPTDHQTLQETTCPTVPKLTGVHYRNKICCWMRNLMIRLGFVRGAMM